jgi:hypothetical protein
MTGSFLSDRAIRFADRGIRLAWLIAFKAGLHRYSLNALSRASVSSS